MKRNILIQIIVVFAFLIYIPSSFSQETKKNLDANLPQGEIPADSETYVIGAEDIIYIHVWKEEALTRTVTVRMDGKISMPLIDETQAAGLTPWKLKEVLTEKLKKYIDNPHVSVIVNEANSFKVYISGQIRTPGVYRLKSETTILQIISMAGGLTDWADQKRIIIIRKEGDKEKKITINYKKLSRGEELNNNIVLKAGDTIIVP